MPHAGDVGEALPLPPNVLGQVEQTFVLPEEAWRGGVTSPRTAMKWGMGDV